jgi:hypothetical protein
MDIEEELEDVKLQNMELKILLELNQKANRELYEKYMEIKDGVEKFLGE